MSVELKVQSDKAPHQNINGLLIPKQDSEEDAADLNSLKNKVIEEEINEASEAGVLRGSPAFTRERRKAQRNRRRRVRQRGNRPRRRVRNGNGNGRKTQGQPLPQNSLATLGSMLSPDVIGFSEAVVHPFGPGAVGALAPDGHNTTAVPATDRLTADIDPALFLNAQENPIISLTGFVVSLVPRSIAAGWLEQTLFVGKRAEQYYALEKLTSGSKRPPGYDQKIEKILGDNFIMQCDEEKYGQTQVPDVKFAAVNPSFGHSDELPQLELYCLIVAAIGQAANDPAPVYRFYSPTTTDSTEPGYNVISMTRYQKLKSVCSGGRMIGGGIKLWAEEAPINVGGTVYGGWIPIQELFASFRGATGAQSPGTIQDSIKRRVTKRGLDGVTVRYSPLQSSLQMQSKLLDLTSFYSWNSNTGTLTSSDNVDLSIYDQIDAASYVPIAVWKYNSTESTDAYSLRLSVRVHVHGVPKGDSPFITSDVKLDSTLKHIVALLEERRVFPAAVGGHSFWSFMKKAGGFVTKTVNGAGHVLNVIKGVSDAIDTVGSIM